MLLVTPAMAGLTDHVWEHCRNADDRLAIWKCDRHVNRTGTTTCSTLYGTLSPACILCLDETMVSENKSTVPDAPLQSTVPDAPLQEERAFFDANRDKLLKDHLGKFALIKGSELIGTFDTDDNAYTEGVERFGNASFLVRKIEERDPTAQFPALVFGLLRAHP